VILLGFWSPVRCAAVGASLPVRLICAALFVYLIIMFARILLSWFRLPHSGPAARLMSILFQLTDPVLRPLRNVIPPVRAGMMAIDLSPILVFVGISVLRIAIGC
jgi:YggT family protein